MRRARASAKAASSASSSAATARCERDEPAAVVDERQVERVEPRAALAQRLAQQRLDRRVAVGVVAGPERQQVEGDVDDRDLGLDRADGDLRPSRAWRLMNGSTRPSFQARISPSRTPAQGERPGGLDDLGELAADVVQVARVEADVRPALVELGADAVVLVLDPDLGAEPA